MANSSSRSFGIADAELGEAARERVDVLGGGVDEEPRQPLHVLVGELADEAEVDEADPAAVEHEHVRRMRVGVEEAVPEDHLHPGVGDPVGQLAAGVDRRRLELEIGELHALEVLERQHPHAGVVPVDLGHDDGVRVREVAPERVGVPRLELVVELLADEARELVDEVVDVDEVERADALPDQAGGLVEEGEVVLDLTRRVRPLHLDDDLVAVRQHRPVHLADRRGCDRRLAELDERLLERQAELALDDLAHLRERERAHVVLEPAQLGDDVRRDDVGPGREQLAELDERRAELVEHLPQVPPALRAGGRFGARARPAPSTEGCR